MPKVPQQPKRKATVTTRDSPITTRSKTVSARGKSAAQQARDTVYKPSARAQKQTQKGATLRRKEQQTPKMDPGKNAAIVRKTIPGAWPVTQSIYDPSLNDEDEGVSKQESPKDDKVEIRFSFCEFNGEDEEETSDRAESSSHDAKPQMTLNGSFSELSVTNQDEAPDKSKTPFVPVLSKHSPREGYGFSYSDSLFYDSEEYPDTECATECDWGSETEDGSNPTGALITTVYAETSIYDKVVVRDVGSFHTDRPQKKLPCTPATREDTLRIKAAAKALIKFHESVEVYEGLVQRVERMLEAMLKKPVRRQYVSKDLTTHCAIKLRDFLLKIREERIATGENKMLVEHEFQWAEWMVRASKSGVMHLKTRECACALEWEE